MRKLNQAMHAVPADAAGALMLEVMHATEEEELAVTTVEHERDLLIRLVLRTTTPVITGRGEDRDVAFVQELAATTDSWATILLGTPVIV